MLAVGIDWSEEFHLVALGRPGEGVFEVKRVEHSPKAVDALIERIAALEPDPAEVRVVLETRHGLEKRHKLWMPESPHAPRLEGLQGVRQWGRRGWGHCLHSNTA